MKKQSEYNHQYRVKHHDKWLEYQKNYNRKYYGESQYAPNHKVRWSEAEVRLILSWEYPDKELSEMLQRSLHAIENARYYYYIDERGRVCHK